MISATFWEQFQGVLKEILAVWFNGDSELKLPGNAMPIHGPPLLIWLALGLWIWSIRWAARDAKARGKSGFVAGVFIIVAAWPFSLWFWRWLRPPLLVPLEARRFAESPELVAPPSPPTSGQAGMPTV